MKMVFNNLIKLLFLFVPIPQGHLKIKVLYF